MACSDPFDALRLATEHLDSELYRRASVQSIWLNVIPRSTYQSGVGLTNSTFTIERSEPTADEETWPAITTIVSGTNSCNTTWNNVNYGYSEQLYSPEQIGLRGPIICKDELIYNFEAARFLEAYISALTIRSQRTVENRLQNIFMHLSPKNTCNAAYTGIAGGALDADHTPPTSPSWSGLPLPTSQLTQDRLDYTAAELITNGATNPDSAGWITPGPNGPVFPLLIGMEASQNIVLNNSEFRQDYRYAEPSTLLRRLGAGVVVKNFRHMINLTPPRFTSGAGQTLVRVNTWQMSAKSKGFGAELTDAYIGAAYEAAIVLSPWVFHSEVIQPVNSAAGLTWDPTNYFGEWQFRTGAKDVIDATAGGENCPTYDPLKKIGRHFAEYKMASRPIFPQFGRVIILKRCPVTSFSSVVCAGVS